MKVGAEAVKIGEAAKVAKSLKFEKVASKALQLEKSFGEGNALVKQVKNLTGTVEELGKLGKDGKVVLKDLAEVKHVSELKNLTKAEEDILKAKGYVDQEGKVLDAFHNDLVAAKGVQFAPKTVAGQIAKGIVPSAEKAIQAVGKVLGSKFVKNTATAAMLGTGATSLYGIGKDMAEAPEGSGLFGSLAYTKPSDFKGALMAGSLAHGLAQNALTAKALERQATKTMTEDISTFKIGDEEVNVKGLFSKPKEIPKVGKIGAKHMDARNESKANEFKQQIAKAYEQTHGKALSEEQIKNINIDDIKIAKGETKGGYILGQNVSAESGNPYRDIRDYKRAERALETNKARPFSGLPTRSKFAVEKGVAPESGQVFKPLTEHATASPSISKEALAKATRLSKEELQALQEVQGIKQSFRSERKALLESQQGISKRTKIYKNAQKKIDELNRKLKTSNWSEKYKQALNEINNPSEFAEGGILKYQTPAQTLQLGALDPTSLKIKAKNKEHLNWNPLSGTAGIFDAKGQYTQDFLNRRKLITPEWFKANQAELQKRIAASGSTFQLNNIDQLLKGTSDYKPGILHDIVMGTIQPMKAEFTNPQENPVVEQPKPEVKPEIKPEPAPSAPTLPTTSTSGDIVAKGNPKPWNWSGVAKYLPDATDISNALMYASTVNTNSQVGDAQRRAVADSMYTVPYMPNQYMRIDSPYTLQGEKQAAALESKAAGVAGDVSDIDKSMAARLTGAAQASAIRDKAHMADQQRTDQMKAQQQQLNAKVAEANTKILGQNRALASQAFSKTHLINANEDLAQNAAFTNFVTAAARNLPAKQYKQNQTALYKAYTNPEYTGASEAYAKLNTDEGQAKYKTQYNADVKNLGYAKPWEESTHYKQWQDDVTKTKSRVETLYKPIQNLMIAQQFQQQLLKSGGSLSKQDKIDIQRDKAESVRELKELEMSFKAIMHNNEMLQKSLIRVFK